MQWIIDSQQHINNFIYNHSSQQSEDQKFKLKKNSKFKFKENQNFQLKNHNTLFGLLKNLVLITQKACLDCIKTFFRSHKKQPQLMKQSLQRKINAYRQAKSTKQSFDGFMQQKKKALKSLLEQQALQEMKNSSLLQLEKQNKYSSTSEFSKRLELKEQEYFRQMEELQKLKLQGIEKSNDLQNLKIEVSFQRKAYQALEQSIKHQRLQNQQRITQIGQKQTQQLKRTLQLYKQRRNANLQHIEQLINAKEQQNEVIMNFLSKKKKFQKDIKELKENHEKGLKDNKKLWTQQEQQSRQKWQKQKKHQITQNTLKGIQPQIQRIITSSKNEIKKIQEKYDIMKQEYRTERLKQYQKRATQMRNYSFALVQQQKTKILTQYSQKLSVQFEALQQQFQKDRKKIRAQRQQQIHLLQQKRKTETQSFILNNKDFYTIHLQQVKAIREQYEQQIRELDGKYQLDIQKQQHLLRVKYNDKMQAQREAKRKELQQRIKLFTVQYEKESESMYEDLVEKVAVENDVYESQVKGKVDEKLKEMRESHESQMKKLKKTIQVLQGKLNALSKQTLTIKKQRQQAEQALEQIKREHQYLQRKSASYQNDIIQKKISISNNANLQQHPSVRSLTAQWQQQIIKAQQSCITLQKQLEQSEEIMAEKIAQLRSDYSDNVNLLQKNSLKLLTLKKNQLLKLKADKEMQEKYSQSLDDMLNKQKLMLEKFQLQQKAMASISSAKRPQTQK